MFSLSFQGVDGPIWVEHLLTSLPGGQLGFLIVVNLLIFFLAFFLDFFELSFIVIPLIGPVAEKLGIDLVWFGVLLAVNMQTSFMHPPFGFALFYLRSVAPTNDYDDKITGSDRSPRSRPGRSTGARCRSCCIQILMVGADHRVPELVSSGLDKGRGRHRQGIPADADDGTARPSRTRPLPAPTRRRRGAAAPAVGADASPTTRR